MKSIERARRVALTITARGGVARMQALREHGVSRHDAAVALQLGAVVRIRHGWLAVPDADPILVAAAIHGGVLTCVTQARRLGLWVHERNPSLHIGATSGSAGGKPTQVHVHWARPLLPRHPEALEDPIENVLALVADCEPFERALATWDSALNQGLVQRSVLERLPLKTVARGILEKSTPFADSGLETYLRPRLSWLHLPLRFQIWIAGHRVDALIGARLVLQIDGATHTGAQRDEDIRHDAELALMGYHVIRIGYRQMMEEWHVVQDLIMRAVAQGLHLAQPPAQLRRSAGSRSAS